jgi:hypothetical protein
MDPIFCLVFGGLALCAILALISDPGPSLDNGPTDLQMDVKEWESVPDEPEYKPDYAQAHRNFDREIDQFFASMDQAYADARRGSTYTPPAQPPAAPDGPSGNPPSAPRNPEPTPIEEDWITEVEAVIVRR